MHFLSIELCLMRRKMFVDMDLCLIMRKSSGVGVRLGSSGVLQILVWDSYLSRVGAL